MSFFEFIGQLLEWRVLATVGTVLLGVASLAAGVFAAIFGSMYISDNFGWGWNLLYLPLIAALALLGFLYALWLGVEVVA